MPESGRAPDVEGLLEGLRDESWSRRADALREATARLSGREVERDVELRFATPIIEAAKDEKWEVRKAAALALAEFRHLDGDVVQQTLDALVKDPNRWVSQAAGRASRHVRARADQAKEWPLTGDTGDPTLQHIASRIREIGLRSLTPARIYDLAIEIGEHFYRDLAADTAHEIKTLLTPFEGYLVELRRHLAEQSQADATAEHYLDTALARLQQLQLMVDNLHVYSSPTTEANFAPVDLGRVVRDAIGIGAERGMSDVKGSTVKQRIHVPDGLMIEALQERLVRAVANLVANAYQAMPEGGTLEVRAKLIGAGSVELSVSDTGHGMSSEEIDQAMERFGTTRRDEGGTGLGLPIAQRIIEHDHGGDLSIESDPGEGTKIVIVLPVRREADEE